MADPIIQAAVDACWREDQLAHAEFYHGMTEAQRRENAAGEHPWRGIVSPPMLRLMAALEAAGHYRGGYDLLRAKRNGKPSPYDDRSGYDYEVSQRIEAVAAERKWAGK